jgi:hypothetical protein
MISPEELCKLRHEEVQKESIELIRDAEKNGFDIIIKLLTLLLTAISVIYGVSVWSFSNRYKDLEKKYDHLSKQHGELTFKYNTLDTLSTQITNKLQAANIEAEQLTMKTLGALADSSDFVVALRNDLLSQLGNEFDQKSTVQREINRLSLDFFELRKKTSALENRIKVYYEEIYNTIAKISDSDEETTNDFSEMNPNKIQKKIEKYEQEYEQNANITIFIYCLAQNSENPYLIRDVLTTKGYTVPDPKFRLSERTANNIFGIDTDYFRERFQYFILYPPDEKDAITEIEVLLKASKIKSISREIPGLSSISIIVKD